MSERSCPTPHKRAFPTAKTAKRSIVRSGVSMGGRLRAYHCDCGAWHLGKVFNGFRPPPSRKRATA